MSIFEEFSDFGDSLLQKENYSNIRPGISLAEVTDIKDKDNLNRVKCRLISVSEEAGDLGWVYVASPFAGKNRGFFFMPSVGDIVLVAFENGDPQRPFVIAGLWGGGQEGPAKIQDGKNETFLIKTPQNNSITLSDVKGKETITIATPKGETLVLNDEAQTAKISDKNGKNSVLIDSKNGAITIKCEKKLTIEVGSGVSITLDGMGGSVKIAGKQSLALEGAQVNIEAKATAKVKASGQLSIESSGLTTVKGSMLKLN